METGKLIRVKDFCEVVSDKFLEHGVKRGHVVFVAGHKALPISENDPYTQRIKFLVNLYNHKTYEIGKTLYLMDPDSLNRYDDKEQKNMMEEYKVANNID